MATVLEEQAWLARVLDASGSPRGAAFAVDSAHLLTCSHVVYAAGARPGDTVSVDFPRLGAASQAEVCTDGWQPEHGTAGDIALLRLVDVPDGLRPAPIQSLPSLDGLRVTVYGFPEGYEDGVSTEGTAGKPAGSEWVKLEISSALKVKPGFSGGAVWSETHRRVVGLITTRDAETEGQVAFAIPMSVPAAASTVVENALPTPLDLDPATGTHWDVRARGVEPHTDRNISLFTGRRVALTELVAWLVSGEPPRMRVVTGPPGVGKSAVLARLVTASDRHYRHNLVELAPDDPSVPPAGTVDVTFHARDRTPIEFAAHLSAVAGFAAATPAGVVRELAEEFRKLVIVIDAIDEATEPNQLCLLLSELAQQGSRVLVGCRDHLVPKLDDPAPLRLDAAPYFEPADIHRYIARMLSASATQGRESSAALLRDVAEAARGNFLVAQLVAHTVALGAPVVRAFPTTVAAAFERFLDALGDAQARELLLPLAYAFGDGLPDDLWLAAAGVMSRPYYPGDLDALLRGPGGAFVITDVSADEGRRHRLFHEALAETLTTDRHTHADHRRLLNTWTEPFRRPHSTAVDWRRAPAYLRQYAAAHAFPAGTLDELAHDASYLLVADLVRLFIRVAHTALSGSEVTTLLRLAALRAQPLGREERAMLLALAAHHLGLRPLGEKLLDEGRPPWRPRWAHSLGSPHQVLDGHSDWVSALALGRVADLDIIASASHDHTLRLWDAASGAPLGELSGHAEPVTAVAIGRAGERDIIASASLDRTVRIWDPVTGQPVGEALTGHAEGVMGVACGRAGEQDIIASGSLDHTVRRWDAVSGHPLGGPLTGHAEPVSAVTCARLGERDIIASASDDLSVSVWDAMSGELLAQHFVAHDDWITAVAIGRAGERTVIVTGSYDQTVGVWDAVSGDLVCGPLTGHDDWVSDVAIGRGGGGDIIASASKDGTVRLWDPMTGQPLGDPLVGHTAWVSAVAIGRGGDRDIIVSGAHDATVRTWDGATDQRHGDRLTGHSARVNAVAAGCTRGRDIIATASDDCSVRLWDAATGLPLGDPFHHVGRARAVAVGRAGGRDLIVSGGDDEAAHLWDVERHESFGEPLTDEGMPLPVTGVACGHIGNRDVVVTASGDASIWDARTGNRIGEPLTGVTTAVAIGHTADQDIIVTLSFLGTVELWDGTTGQSLGAPLTSDTAAVACAHASDRDVIVTGSNSGTVQLWDATSRQPLGHPLAGHSAPVSAVAIGRVKDRDVIFTGSADETVRLWDVRSRRPLSVVHTLGPVAALAVGAEGALYIATGFAVCSVVPSLDAAT